MEKLMKLFFSTIFFLNLCLAQSSENVVIPFDILDNIGDVESLESLDPEQLMTVQKALGGIKVDGKLGPETMKAMRGYFAYLKILERLNGSIPKEYIKEAFSHSKLEIHKEIADRFARPYEKKTWVEYRKIFVKESRIASGAKFYKENKKLISEISDKYSMDPFIIVTIAGVESNYGVHHSQFSVFNSLYTQIQEMPRRSKWATKELAEFLKYCFNDKLDPQEIGGSYAGAFGFGQFIPSSFTRYSIDYNNNGVREPYGWPDVLGSIANYLRMNGYKSDSNNYEEDGDIWKSIYAYNHSDNYVMAVLELTEEIRKRAKAE
jgi:membrane-bound lytic murein transglycosylase B